MEGTQSRIAVCKHCVWGFSPQLSFMHCSNILCPAMDDESEISALVLHTWPDLMQDRGYEVPRTHLFVGTWAKTSEQRAEFIRNSSLTTSMRV
jgi:hypothetical protein